MDAVDVFFLKNGKVLIWGDGLEGADWVIWWGLVGRKSVDGYFCANVEMCSICDVVVTVLCIHCAGILLAYLRFAIVSLFVLFFLFRVFRSSTEL